MPLPPVALNKIRVAKGATKVFTVTVKTAAGRPFNLNGFVIVMSVSNDVGLAIHKVSPDGIEITCPSEGVITVTLESVDTNISPGCYRWDMWAIKPADVVGDPDTRYQIVGASDFTVTQSVTVF